MLPCTVIRCRQIRQRSCTEFPRHPLDPHGKQTPVHCAAVLPSRQPPPLIRCNLGGSKSRSPVNSIAARSVPTTPHDDAGESGHRKRRLPLPGDTRPHSLPIRHRRTANFGQNLRATMPPMMKSTRSLRCRLHATMLHLVMAFSARLPRPPDFRPATGGQQPLRLTAPRACRPAHECRLGRIGRFDVTARSSRRALRDAAESQTVDNLIRGSRAREWDIATSLHNR